MPSDIKEIKLCTPYTANCRHISVIVRGRKVTTEIHLWFAGYVCLAKKWMYVDHARKKNIVTINKEQAVLEYN